MSNSTWSGPIRSLGGFRNISRNPTTGVETELWRQPGALTTGAATGITTGVGTVYKSGILRQGGIIETSILIDLTGLRSTAAGDILGVNGTALACHIGQYLTAESGAPFAGRMTCLVLPTGSTVDIDVFAAAEGTGAEDTAISTLNETQLVNSGNLTLGATVNFTALPTTGQYLYLVAGATLDADYTAGKLLIQLFGTI